MQPNDELATLAKGRSMLFNNTYALPPEGVLTWSPFSLYPIGMPTLMSLGRSYLAAKPDVEAFLHYEPGVLNLPLGVRIGKLKLCLVILHLGRIPAWQTYII